ncbi:MAG: hypothetical protein U9Q67_02035, partial [Patescibacteria group bacterium]|nr:hypothetical protein [Patescibacteria group bacterium]
MTVSHQVTESLIFENRDLRIDQRHRLFSPIRRFDESDVETRTTIWPRLETALRFHRTHNKANSPGPAVEDQINIARLFAAGYTYSEIMYTYGLTHLVKVRASYRNVNQLLLGILSQEEKAMLGIPESVRPSERYSEILEIHDAYSMLPGVIQSLREDSSPYVRQLIKRNPHFEYLILMLAQGYGFRDLAEMWGIDKYSKQGICHLRISYRNRFLHGRESATTGHKFLRNLVFAKFLATKERWSGYDPYDNLTGLFREVSNYPDRSSTYVGGLQHILSLIVLLHFKTMINEESRNPDDLAAVFP